MIGGHVYKSQSAGQALERQFGAAAAAGKGKKGGARVGNVRDLSSISHKLHSAIGGGKDTALDKELKSMARQKQQKDLAMTPDVRLQAYKQREPVRPVSDLFCPNKHKLAGPAVRKVLSTHDIYTCPEPGCGAMCGGVEQVHPLFLQLKLLHPVDKNTYLDKVPWMSKSQVDVETEEYIRGQNEQQWSWTCAV
jgi:hypothetical protein